MKMNTGNQIIPLPSPAQTNDVRLQWRALLNTKWSLDNVRIGNDALLYHLQFEIQVGRCSSPPINGSASDYVSLEYYDGSTWSLLQNECLHPKCFLMVIICLYSCIYVYSVCVCVCVHVCVHARECVCVCRLPCIGNHL